MLTRFDLFDRLQWLLLFDRIQKGLAFGRT